MSVVFFGLILLYAFFKIVGRVSVNLSKRNAMKAKGITDKQEAKEKKLGEAPGEIFAAIAMAMHEMQERCTRCGGHRAYYHPRKTQLLTMEFEDLHFA